MSNSKTWDFRRLALEKIQELEAMVDVHEQQAAINYTMVPMYVHLPLEVYHRLRAKAQELGRPPQELASLWLWRATVEFKDDYDNVG